MTIGETKIKEIEIRNDIKKLRILNAITIGGTLAVLSAACYCISKNEINFTFISGVLLGMFNIEIADILGEISDKKKELINLKKELYEEVKRLESLEKSVNQGNLNIDSEYSMDVINKSEEITHQLLSTFKEEQKTNTITR